MQNAILDWNIRVHDLVSIHKDSPRAFLDCKRRSIRRCQGLSILKLSRVSECIFNDQASRANGGSIGAIDEDEYGDFRGIVEFGFESSGADGFEGV